MSPNEVKFNIQQDGALPYVDLCFHAYHPYLVCILFGMPSLHLFTFLMFFIFLYNIGLGLVTQTLQKLYIIQLNVPQAAEKRYLLLNNLHTALLNDPDLASVPRDSIGVTMQTLFISTSCDFVSYFKSLGKATILNIFFQHAEFICGANTPGCLHHTLPHNRESGFLSFIRFIGTCYFKKHLLAFTTLYGLETPKHLYNSIDPSLPPNEKQELWLKKIRNAVSNIITNEEEFLLHHYGATGYSHVG